MLQSLPQPKRRNAPWTPLQRRTWLATQRRRKRLEYESPQLENILLLECGPALQLEDGSNILLQ